jgi:UPF0716 protein FxsA
MLLRLLLLFTLVPLVELAVLIWLATKAGLGLGWTLCLVVVTGALGAALARHQGLRCLDRIRQKLAAGELPSDPLLDGLLILLAGALLITPGVLTDLLGFALLLPPFRRIVKRRLIRRFQARLRIFPTGSGWPRPGDQPAAHDRIIDAHVIDAPPEPPDRED